MTKDTRLSVEMAIEHVENGHHGEFQHYCYRCEYWRLFSLLQATKAQKAHAWLVWLSSAGLRTVSITDDHGQDDRDKNHHCRAACPGLKPYSVRFLGQQEF